MDTLEPAGPILTAALFEPLGQELLRLLRNLRGEDWDRSTVCAGWTVHDIAAHLLDTAWRRLSGERDGHSPPPPTQPIAGYGDLVTFLNQLNTSWVDAWRRVSPQLILDSLEIAEGGLAAHLPSMDPFARAAFSVAWAGESESLVWFDQARELTERWHHQQQIRLAVGAPALDDPRFSRPVLETFLRALTWRYAALAAAEGATVGIEIMGAENYTFALRRGDTGWSLHRGWPGAPVAAVRLGEEAAWRLLTRSLSGDAARSRAKVEGDPKLLDPFFSTLAVMA